MASRTTFGGGTPYATQLPADRGYVAWTQPLNVLTGTNVATNAGVLNLRRIRRVPACTVASIVTHLLAAGSGLTAGQCFAALYTASGNLIAQTADQSTAWATVGPKVMPLVGGPYTVPSGDYYVAYWYNGTTGPGIVRSASIGTGVTNMGLPIGSLECATANTGVTTTAPATFGTQSGATLEFWFALA